MKKVILVDGNNLMFRSYYATAYSGNMMKNSKGMPTNGLYGFVNMINKIINEEKPKYMVVAFDKGVNFRKAKYDTYKAGRSETPSELKVQMPIARDLLTAMGIKYLEMEPYEADDIIGTIAKMADLDSDYDATIISSDKDLLQLISPVVDVKLLKTKGFIRYNRDVFFEEYGIEPINIIDMKAIAGDSSDNIPGVKGIGDKGALKLLQEFTTVEGVYENIELVKGKTREKLELDKESAFISKEIATIYKDVPLGLTLDDFVYEYKHSNELNKLYQDLEFYSFIKDHVEVVSSNNEYQVIKSASNIKLSNEYSFYIECSKENYHEGEILGMSLSTESDNYYVQPHLINDVFKIIGNSVLYTYDFKKGYNLLSKLGVNLKDINFDLMIALYLLNYNVKDDIAYIMNSLGNSMSFYDELVKLDNIETLLINKSRFIYDNRDKFMIELKSMGMDNLFNNIEMPLVRVLSKMELEGIKVNKEVLKTMSDELKVLISSLESEIHSLVGEEFNISSPKQLGVILFEKLGLNGGKVGASGSYKTDVKVLEKLVGSHPVIDKILEYRNLTKLNSTYLEGLSNYVVDGFIHTIYKQTLTRTGRLSSVEPNLQNIPTRTELGRSIRKAFVPKNDIFFAADYSQIELRVLAHISNEEELIKAFVNKSDIHTKVAADIFGIKESDVSKDQRRTAKAVIFGIVYGISGFGLGNDLKISVKEAQGFIEKYYSLYPKVKLYMDNVIKEAYDEGSVRTLYGRKRLIEELSNKNYMIRQMGERIALNTPIQGTAADIIKMAMIKIDKEMESRNLASKMILQVHDELVFDCVISEKEEVETLVSDIMEGIVSLDVPLVVSHDFGTTWYEAK